MASICTSNVTSGFIDLATFDEIEKYMYGGSDATAYFVRETRKSTWFTQVPVVLSKASGQPGFGQEWAVSISRAGDYLLQTWLRVEIPAVALASGSNPGNAIRWTKNLGHNLIKECCITFNDLVAARFDNYHLDFWAAFTVPAGKRDGYNQMIGNIPSLIFPTQNTNNGRATSLPATVLNIPLPFFYTRDSGVALPTAALPYNEMRINFSFRDWSELLVYDLVNVDNIGTSSAAYSLNSLTTYAVSPSYLTGGAPQLNNVQVWANYAIVSNDERKRMACAPRDILIEQVQTAPRQTFAPVTNSQPQYDIRFSHAIKALFFAVRNKSIASSWSNYTVTQPIVDGDTSSSYPRETYTATLVNVADDPILNATLTYENTQRLYNMTSDYYSLVNPYYTAPDIPLETGYHLYSYSLDFICLDPMGSTNYGKLTNVSIIPQASPAALYFANTATNSTYSASTSPMSWLNYYVASSGNNSYYFSQQYEFILTAVNNNIIRISGGALGFPVL